MKILLSLFLSSVLSFGAVFAGMPVRSVSVSAAETETGKNAFDDTDVNEDISAVLLSELIAEAGEDGIAVYFTEYCFAAETEKNVNYGLYVYVCNVRGYDFVAEDGKNALNMAVSYDADGNPTKYANMDLHYCGQSTGINAGLLWKFRVTDEDNEILSNALEQNRLHGERRYDLAGIQLRREGYALANDYKVGAIYRFSGYAAGYGKYVDGNTLTVTKETSDTAELDVRHAFYRPEGYNMALYTQDSLASVYFAVPDELIRKYGELYAVHCSYLEAVTDDIFVTGNSDVYNELSAHVGEDLGNLDLRYGFGAGRTQDTLIITYAASYNKKILNNGIFKHVSNREIDNLKYVFPVAGGMDETDSADGYVLQWEVLQEYMLDYSAGKDDLLYGRYARELFSSVADEETDITLSADDTFDLTSISVDWDSFWDGTWGQDTGGEVPVIQPVENVLSAAQAEEEYYIDESCYKDFKDYYDENSDDGTVYVFHFAMDGYYAPEAVNLDNNDTLNYETDTNAYMARETVYLNFDVIDISLKSDAGEVTVLGAVSNPIDVIPSVTPPVDTTSDEWTEWPEEFMKAFLSIIGIIGGIAVVALLWGPLSTLLGLLLKLICMPFKALSNAVKEHKKNKRE